MARKRHDHRRFVNDRHHVVPTSRFKPGEDPNLNNVVEWDKGFHQAWHYLFANMAVEEAIAFIKLVSSPGETWDRKRLHLARKSIIEHHGGEYLTRKPKRRKP